MALLRIFCGAVGLLCAGATLAAPSDPHLASLPWSAADRAQVAATLAATRDAARHPAEHLPAGAATVSGARGVDAFSRAFANLPKARELDFLVGRSLFRRLWRPAPDRASASDGLGPLFNARSCEACHPNNGRGVPPRRGAPPVFPPVSPSLVLKLSDGRGGPDPVYGAQLQTGAVPEIAAEAVLNVTRTAIVVPLSGGETRVLRRPVYTVTGLAQGPLAAPLAFSPRIAPQMPGLGLIEAIRSIDILAAADPQDADGDGISGRARIVQSREYGVPMIGRFGRKGGIATLRAQAADAFAQDMGLSTPLFPAAWGDCTTAQPDCRHMPHGDADPRGVEVDADALDLVTLYSARLGLPARRADDPQVLRGKAVFYDTGCVACHRPAYVTHRLADDPSRSFQLIWPYSDFLLHDMGPDLADTRPEGDARPQDWKTPPLWGLGRAAEVSGSPAFLHDGRADTVLDAILWHGGEAQSARDRVVAMPPVDRADLIRFLQSL